MSEERGIVLLPTRISRTALLLKNDSTFVEFYLQESYIFCIALIADNRNIDQFLRLWSSCLISIVAANQLFRSDLQFVVRTVKDFSEGGVCTYYHLEDTQERIYFLLLPIETSIRSTLSNQYSWSELWLWIYCFDRRCNIVVRMVGIIRFHLEESQEWYYFLLLPIDTSIRSTVSNQVSWSELWLWIYCFDRRCNIVVRKVKDCSELGGFSYFHHKIMKSQEQFYFLLLPIKTSIRSTVSNQDSWSELWLWIYCFDRRCNIVVWKVKDCSELGGFSSFHHKILKSKEQLYFLLHGNKFSILCSIQFSKYSVSMYGSTEYIVFYVFSLYLTQYANYFRTPKWNF